MSLAADKLRYLLVPGSTPGAVELALLSFSSGLELSGSGYARQPFSATYNSGAARIENTNLVEFGPSTAAWGQVIAMLAPSGSGVTATSDVFHGPYTVGLDQILRIPVGGITLNVSCPASPSGEHFHSFGYGLDYEAAFLQWHFGLGGAAGPSEVHALSSMDLGYPFTNNCATTAISFEVFSDASGTAKARNTTGFTFVSDRPDPNPYLAVELLNQVYVGAYAAIPASARIGLIGNIGGPGLFEDGDVFAAGDLEVWCHGH